MASLENLKNQLLSQSKGKFISTMGDEPEKEGLTSPAYDLNRILSGSLYKSVQVGTHTALVGPEACVSEDTIIPFERFSISENRRLTHKKETIKNLYNRFHGIQDGKSGYHKFRKLDDIVYYIKSINEENRIIRNLVVDVVKTGEKRCFKITTIDGQEISTSKDHKFYIGNGEYKPLEELKEGDKVYIHTNKRYKKDKNRWKNNHKYVNVKYHPYGKEKKKNGCYYSYIRRPQLVYEAYLNNMSVDEYREYLNKQTIKNINNLKFIDPSLHIHHINKDPGDDRIENLELLDEFTHLSKHAKENHNNMRFIAYETKIKSIESVGKKETYDIKCLSPYNNYIANNFVTHNSGKSSFMALMLADAQKKGYLPVIIDAEGAWDKDFVTRWGIDPNNVLKIETLWVDDIMPELAKFIEGYKEGNEWVKFENMAIVVDSIGALDSKKVIRDGVDKNDVKADQGRLQKDIKRMLKMIVSLTKFNNSVAFSAGHFYGNPTGYGEPEALGGGKYYRLSADTIVSLKKSPIYENPGEKKDKRGKVLGNKITAATLKNRKYPPFQEAVVEIDYRNGVNADAGLIEVASDIGLIQQSGAWYTCEPLGIKAQGQPKLLAELEKIDNQLFYDKIEEHLKTTGYSTVNKELELQEELNETAKTEAVDDIPEPEQEKKVETTTKKKPGRPKTRKE